MTTTPDNPTITCTVKQLAFVAWQRRRNPNALPDNSDVMDAQPV